MPEGQDFALGNSIWPGVSSVGGTALEETTQRIRHVVSELAEYVAQSLEDLGLPRFAFFLFRPFNALFAVSHERLICVASPLSGGVAALSFIDWRENPPPVEITVEAVADLARRQLGWSDLAWFQLPAGLLNETSESRAESLKRLAFEYAQQIKTEVEKKDRRITLRPIFPTQPEELERNDELCFVLMPFLPQFDRLYEDVIVPTIRQTGLRPLRADEVFSPSPIVDEIWKHIVTARLIIADVTGKNPNVFYELGLAHAVGRPVIILTQASEDIPFDVAYIRYFSYTDDEKGWSRLRTDLAAAIQAALQIPA